MTSDDDRAAYRLWRVTINRHQSMRVAARSAGDAATVAGDRWRDEHTDGRDRGGIERIDVEPDRR